MKILIYGVNYAPELTGIGKYSGEMAEWLVAQGHEVRVVTAPPYYPEWKLSKGFANRFSQEDIHGVKVLRCPLYVPAKPSGLKRIVHLASFALSSFPVMLKQVFWKPDVVMVLEPPLFCSPTAWLTSRLAGGKCWLHVQDFEVDAAFDLGIIPFAWMKAFVSNLERWLMQRFDVVSTISHSMLARLKDKGVNAPVFFPNWSDLSRIRYDAVEGSTFRAGLNVLPEHCLCLYSGNIAVKQGLEIILDVAKELTDYQFVICGEGASKFDLQNKSKELLLNNIIFLPLQPLEELSAMLSAADIHLVVQKGGAADLVMPSKLTNILAVGGAAIVTTESDTELGRLARGDAPCVLSCEPENAEALIMAIKQLNADKRLHAALQRNAMAYATQHIDMNEVLGKLENKMLEFIK
ncbi:MAG: glycosyltransferase WbuB [Zetaproteobacteria bacterium]|nr:glycosyltransferase WbuB [Zetaproteobacteria bacterium]